MNNLFKQGSAAMLCLLIFCFNVQAAGGIALGATRVIYPADAKQTSLSINNSDNKERYLVNSWVENNLGVKDKTFIVTPPLFVSEPSSENTLRIIYAGPPLPADRESVFWMNVKAIPSVDKNTLEGSNVLQLAILSRIKLFVRPKNLQMQPEEAVKQLRFSRSGEHLRVHNPSPYYISTVNLKVGNEKLVNTMVAPKSVAQVIIPAGIKGAISFQTVNDYGAVTPVQAGVML
ncbi:type 1 fimbria chaperone FimC [Buttiauxella agrestis]|uniref:SfmC family fimbrial periplasmic chaperone n=1 Tax=Buttiauxella agrestis ATCC 33320 TaxID=1006004 RepID=A0A085G9T5_9ENTR|nr:type 1 fimbria chaperone FimC [Buttiauxella agrestis]KFC80480.1 SfmC family fimbrial periplasmic chaperone [Buttiauxella agrestis ATCC 33320]